MPIRASDRILVVGSTGSGKSVLARFLFDQFRTRRVVIDHKRELNLPGAMRAVGPRQLASALATEVRTIRYVPPTDGGSPGEYERVYAAIMARREPIVTWTDELYGPGDANQAPRSMRNLMTMGRSLGKGHVGATQRPVRVCKEAITEADHVMVFTPPLQAADLKPVAASMNLESERQLRALLTDLPRFGWLWFDRREQTLRPAEPVPLPGRARRQTSPAATGRGSSDDVAQTGDATPDGP